MEEIWKDVVGYEGLYEVSNLGRIKRSKNNTIRKQFNNFSNYRKISLRNSKQKMYFVHRLVAQAFIPNPENKPFINHIDSCRSNNIISNLEWCTQKENMQHAVSKGRIHPLGNKTNHKNMSSTEDRENFKKLYSKGLKLREISVLTGFSIGTVWKYL